MFNDIIYFYCMYIYFSIRMYVLFLLIIFIYNIIYFKEYEIYIKLFIKFKYIFL